VSYLVGLPLVALAAVLQATVLANLRPLGSNLDLVLLLTLSWTLSGEWQAGAFWGVMGGLCLDTLSGGPFGASALGLVFVAYLTSLTEGRFWRSHVLLPLACALAGTVIFHLLSLAALAVTGHSVDWAGSLFRLTLPAVLLNTLLMLPVYHLLRGLHSLVRPAPVTL